jgi:hypothetical protein
MAISTIQNFYKETITRAVTLVGATNIYVSALPTPDEGYVVISPSSSTLREIVYYTAKGTDGNGTYLTITLANRGLGGTTAQTHAIGEPVRMNVTAEHIKEISDALDQIVAAGAQDASTTTKGIAKLSVAPASATNPIAVGTNDPRMGQIIPVGGMIEWYSDTAYGNAITIDDFQRDNSSTIGGGWTEVDTGGIASINGNKMVVTFDTTNIVQIYRDHEAGMTSQKLTFLMKFNFHDDVSSIEPNIYLFYKSDGTATKGYGIKIVKKSSNNIIISDDNSDIQTATLSLSLNTDYLLEMIVNLDGSMDGRIWESSASRPSTATISTAARAVTASGVKTLVGFGRGGVGVSNLYLYEIYYALGSDGIVYIAPPAIPSGFLATDGSAISRETYATLFSLIGISFGGGDGSTTFNLPTRSLKIIKY